MSSHPSNKRLHFVCRVDELPPGSMRLFPLGRFGIGVFNVDGRFHALTNYCPHEGGPLCAGYVRGTPVADEQGLGGVRWSREGEIIRCPWHQWEFEIATGKTLSTPVRGIRTYPVEISDENVFLCA